MGIGGATVINCVSSTRVHCWIERGGVDESSSCSYRQSPFPAMHPWRRIVLSNALRLKRLSRAKFCLVNSRVWLFIGFCAIMLWYCVEFSECGMQIMLVQEIITFRQSPSLLYLYKIFMFNRLKSAKRLLTQLFSIFLFFFYFIFCDVIDYTNQPYSIQ